MGTGTGVGTVLGSEPTYKLQLNSAAINSGSATLLFATINLEPCYEQLRVLSLSNNFLDDTIILPITRLIERGCLTRLDLSKNFLTIFFFQSLLSVILNLSLDIPLEIDLSQNWILFSYSVLQNAQALLSEPLVRQSKNLKINLFANVIEQLPVPDTNLALMEEKERIRQNEASKKALLSQEGFLCFKGSAYQSSFFKGVEAPLKSTFVYLTTKNRSLVQWDQHLMVIIERVTVQGVREIHTYELLYDKNSSNAFIKHQTPSFDSNTRLREIVQENQGYLIRVTRILDASLAEKFLRDLNRDVRTGYGFNYSKFIFSTSQGDKVNCVTWALDRLNPYLSDDEQVSSGLFSSPGEVSTDQESRCLLM